VRQRYLQGRTSIVRPLWTWIERAAPRRRRILRSISLPIADFENLPCDEDQQFLRKQRLFTLYAEVLIAWEEIISVVPDAIF
jgi:hypothetical protein